MVGYPPSNGKLIIVTRERHGKRSTPDNDQDSQRFGEIMEQMAAVDYTDLASYVGTYI